ncbi:gamma-glutamylcyclotransferase [Amylibacter sp. SFDW26]|uniref:gamma-glutamylcyclotransferase family protein n=1 Tax=Amylibacter sp. SFDW26 TaxID=2652722 RepID=UPI0012614325|nr:gamma-glutamylcyclotransferase family protein [Amylibacter sp. SFDW26]KAB7613805.1 gamma-glutamylcyclotransferase [Amylibacter sp. SFDW26]
MTASKTSFFGYGSLVNLATHIYENPRQASVTGWRREWVTSNSRDVSYLSIRPDPDCTIDGMKADVAGIGWDALDEREAGYNRLDPANADFQVYVADPDFIDATGPTKPILLSYIDCVIQGFHTHYGDKGVARFFDTTTAWDRPILNDRKTPLYPRAQVLSPIETGLVDEHLEHLKVQIIS